MKKLLFLLLLIPCLSYSQVSMDTNLYLINANPGGMRYAPRGDLVYFSMAGKMANEFAGNRIYVSSDTGQTWGNFFTLATSYDPHASWWIDEGDTLLLATNQVSRVVLYRLTESSGWTLQDSIDGGVWEAYRSNVSVLFTKCVGDTCLSIARTTTNTGSSRLVWWSTDGGDTWDAGDTAIVFSDSLSGHRVDLHVANETIYYSVWFSTGTTGDSIDVYEWDGNLPPTFTLVGDNVIAPTSRAFSVTDDGTSLYVAGLDLMTDDSVTLKCAYWDFSDGTYTWTTIPNIEVAGGNASITDLWAFGITNLRSSGRILATYNKLKPNTAANFQDSTDIAVRALDKTNDVWYAYDSLVSVGYETLYSADLQCQVPRVAPSWVGDKLQIMFNARGGDAADTDPDMWLVDVTFTDIVTDQPQIIMVTQ